MGLGAGPLTSLPAEDTPPSLWEVEGVPELAGGLEDCCEAHAQEWLNAPAGSTLHLKSTEAELMTELANFENELDDSRIPLDLIHHHLSTYLWILLGTDRRRPVAAWNRASRLWVGGLAQRWGAVGLAWLWWQETTAIVQGC